MAAEIMGGESFDNLVVGELFWWPYRHFMLPCYGSSLPIDKKYYFRHVVPLFVLKHTLAWRKRRE
jgi:hypothetical protein